MSPGFTGATIDRADRVRADPEALAAVMADPRARLLRWRNLDPEIADGHLAWGPLADAPAGGEVVFLGLDEGVPCFAAADPAEPPVKGRNPAIFAALAALPVAEAALYAGARSVVDWHMRHRFCAQCGTPTAPFKAGWGRRCPACSSEHFPRTDPVVIMLAEFRGRALLGRGRGWPPGRYSALAGFVEPGESIEEAVARETLEESGVRVAPETVRYIASQPWPFPSSLMIACIGAAQGDALDIDTTELEDVIWVTRDEVRASFAGEPAPFLPPPPFAIAHTLLRTWMAEQDESAEAPRLDEDAR
ncbi:NAD(+) diphosphatase [Sphingomonas canadensis]|uniref:NAD(+) diphosphatase n=1 Tax=Sphingomonas canadensis TaxID=1219257 RepID=A0ABW3H8A2_9SPHN|nr:NAD(+) diphosphatase [Sphingomonas canadensis]MCW3834556.1 NAD(+) diphosphatase [Sphingomonas canadensis]